MSDISQKTKIPLGWAMSIIASLVGVVFAAGAAHFRLQTLEHNWIQYREQRRQAQALVRQQQLKLQRLDISLSNIQKSIISIDKKLDRLEVRNGR